MQIQGTIRYIDLSGGFWGIEGDNGQKYAPISDIPTSFQQEGLRIKAQLQPAQAFSIMMWGQHVEVSKLEKI